MARVVRENMMIRNDGGDAGYDSDGGVGVREGVAFVDGDD